MVSTEIGEERGTWGFVSEKEWNLGDGIMEFQSINHQSIYLFILYIIWLEGSITLSIRERSSLGSVAYGI